MRLIDADALRDESIVVNIGPDFNPDYENMIYTSDIDEAPTIDAVPVVRCKDCKLRGDTFYCPLTININCGNGFRSVFAGADNDFCSKGARMDGEA